MQNHTDGSQASENHTLYNMSAHPGERPSYAHRKDPKTAKMKMQGGDNGDECSGAQACNQAV